MTADKTTAYIALAIAGLDVGAIGCSPLSAIVPA